MPEPTDTMISTGSLAARVLGGLPDAVLLVGEDGRVEYASPSVQAVFGWSPDELRGAPVERLLPDDRAVSHAGQRQAFTREPGARAMGGRKDLQGRRRDGSLFDADVMLNVLDLDGRRLVVAVVRDVSAHRAADRALAQTTDELRVANETLATRARELAALDARKDALLGHAAHDLRNPLGIIVGYTRFLLDALETIEPGELREILASMERSAKSMARLVDDLVDVSAIEAGTLRLALASVDLREVVDGALAGVRGMASAKGIRLIVERPSDPMRCTVDADRFAQVVENLATNAIKYSEPGTTIEVHLSCRGDRVALLVADQGVGIAPDALERIFRPFEKARASGTAGEKSFGLGLSIVKKIVDAHGGTIRAESEVGKGSRFSVELPGRPSDARLAAPPEALS